MAGAMQHCCGESEESGLQLGLLWFDDNPRLSVSAKIEQAARRYREKFGRAPDTCYVHTSTLAGATGLPANLHMAERSNIPPNSFWIGVKSA